MTNGKFQNRYRIPSARAQWHSYDGGAYYITICTNNREHFFGEISNGEMRHSEIGQYITENLQNVTEHYPYAEIPIFVVMPNHLHAVVIIDGNKTPGKRRDAARHVSTTTAAVPTDKIPVMGKNKKMQDIANQSGWLSVTIGGIKSAVTKFAHENNINFAWQPRFHDHIIRDSEEMIRIADYIENNVAQWTSASHHDNNPL